VSTRYVEYVTVEGDRWDLIAFRMYGDAYAYEPIIVANPDVKILPVLPAGTRLLIPVLAAPTTNPADVPPWKR
jgi:phage tail protein X